MSAIELTVGAHLLRVETLASLCDIDLKSFARTQQRLVLVAGADRLWDAPGLTTHFETTLGRRGVLAGARTKQPPALAKDLGLPAGITAEWLEQGGVTIACLGVPADVVAAAVLGASGGTVGQALDLVRTAVPEALPSPSDEILVSRATEHALAWRDLSRRRAALRAAGRSPW